MTDKNKNSIRIFQNTKKVTENHPDLNCFLFIDGVEYECGLWKTESKQGNKYYSGTPKVKEREIKNNKRRDLE